MAPRVRETYPSLPLKKNNTIHPIIKPHEPLRNGEVLSDVAKQKWKIGRCIGVGAFGVIYLASDDISKSVGNDSSFVIKVEPHNNGPLFVEMNFYLRVAQEDLIDKWKSAKRLKSLGMPKICGFGSHCYKNEKYRFIVLPRFGDDINKIFLKHSKKFHVKTAFTLASHVMDILEYIHSRGYVHLDVKGLNMLLGDSHSPVYLVDYGLAARYIMDDGSHKTPDGRLADAGTMEFSSRDAHVGALSRRSDLESLGYNIVYWLGGTLPWQNDLDNPEHVANLKETAMSNIKNFLNTAFSGHPPAALMDYLYYISTLELTSEPDYRYCKGLFSREIQDNGFLDDKKITFDSHAPLKKKANKRKASENFSAPRKKYKPNNITNRKPCSVQNLNMMRVVTRNQSEENIKLRSKKKFDWATVLAGNPEKLFHQSNKEQKDSPQLARLSGDHPTKATKSNQMLKPTPAMVRVIRRRKSKCEERKPKTLLLSGSQIYLTPAMEEVVLNRLNGGKQLRTSSRKIARQSLDAIFACGKF